MNFQLDSKESMLFLTPTILNVIEDIITVLMYSFISGLICGLQSTEFTYNIMYV